MVIWRKSKKYLVNYKNTSHGMVDDSEYMHDKDRQNINSAPEKFHAANAHDIMEYLMSL